MLLSMPTYPKAFILDVNFVKLQPCMIKISNAFLELFWRILNRCCMKNLNEEPDVRLF